MHKKAVYLRTNLKEYADKSIRSHTLYLVVPKVAFPHSPEFTVPGRNTRAIFSSIYEGLNVFPFHILTRVR